MRADYHTHRDGRVDVSIGTIYIGIYPSKGDAILAAKKYRAEQRAKNPVIKKARYTSKNEEKIKMFTFTKLSSTERQFGFYTYAEPMTVYNPWVSCCGAAYVSSFYRKQGRHDDEKGLKLYKSDLIASLEEQKKQAIKCRIGMLMAIVNHTQVDIGAAEALEAAGFKLIDAATNPNHSNQSSIYLYSWHAPTTLDVMAKEKKVSAFDQLRDKFRKEMGLS